MRSFRTPVSTVRSQSDSHGDLTARGFRIWWDEQALRSRGRNVATEIRDVISASGEHFLLLVGRGTLEREYVKKELELAESECKIVVPLRLSPHPLARTSRQTPSPRFQRPGPLRGYPGTGRGGPGNTDNAARTPAGRHPQGQFDSDPVWLRRSNLIDLPPSVWPRAARLTSRLPSRPPSSTGWPASANQCWPRSSCASATSAAGSPTALSGPGPARNSDSNGSLRVSARTFRRTTPAGIAMNLRLLGR